MLLEGVEARATYFNTKERRDLLRVFQLLTCRALNVPLTSLG